MSSSDVSLKFLLQLFATEEKAVVLIMPMRKASEAHCEGTSVCLPTGVGWWAPLLTVWAQAKPSLWYKPSVLWALPKHSRARKVSEGQTPKGQIDCLCGSWQLEACDANLNVIKWINKNASLAVVEAVTTSTSRVTALQSSVSTTTTVKDTTVSVTTGGEWQFLCANCWGCSRGQSRDWAAVPLGLGTHLYVVTFLKPREPSGTRKLQARSRNCAIAGLGSGGFSLERREPCPRWSSI